RIGRDRCDHGAAGGPRRPTRRAAPADLHREDDRGRVRSPSYVASRLSQLAVRRWEEVNGYAVAHGLPDLRAMTMGAFLDFVYYLFTRNGDEQSVEKFRRTLWMPPKG